jgi:hypothetical protein
MIERATDYSIARKGDLRSPGGTYYGVRLVAFLRDLYLRGRQLGPDLFGTSFGLKKPARVGYRNWLGRCAIVMSLVGCVTSDFVIGNKK